MDLLRRIKKTKIEIVVLAVFAYELVFPHIAFAATNQNSVMVPKLYYNSAEISQNNADSGRTILVRLDGIKRVFAQSLALYSQNNDATTTPAISEAVKSYNVKKTYKIPVTAYTSEAAQTDESPCITANGYNLCEHNEENVIAANFLPMGTKVRIPDQFGDRVFTVQDRMNSRYDHHVDVWMKDHSDAVKFGVKIATVQVVE